MKYLIKFSYDGSSFYGYQKQKDKNTVQGTIENLLKNRFMKDIQLVGCGRTDRAVHAINYYATFESDKINIDRLKIYLNSKLEGKIYIKMVKEVPDDFHPRYSIKEKTYKYIINTKEFNVWERNYVYEYCKDIDIKKINDIIPLFTGKHNFENFTTISDKKESYEREIYSIKIESKNGYINIYITGNGFLRYMVRNIIGCIFEYIEGKITKKEIEDMLENKTKRKPVKVSPNGLYLYDVIYQEGK